MISLAPSHHGYRFPSDIIAHAVWLYFRFSLSFRDVEDLLAQRGIDLPPMVVSVVMRELVPGCSSGMAPVGRLLARVADSPAHCVAAPWCTADATVRSSSWRP